MLNVHHIFHGSHIYGPGTRDVVWFKGCTFHCEKCINPELWDTTPENLMTVDELVSTLHCNEITLLGGEPLQQEDIGELITRLKEKNIGIILFTGYSLKKISLNLREIVSMCDVVISEPYVDALKDDSLYLRGSSNQIISFNSERYTKKDFEKCNSYEVVLGDKSELHGRSKSFVDELLLQ